MRFRDDERAQSVQIGAILLFAVLILSFSTYQAVVVPQQNGRVEFNHNEQVHQQLQDLRNAIVSVRGGTGSQATTVALGTQYPGRAVAVNPPPPVGALRTDGTGDPLVNVSVRNATATGETRDVWNGTARNYSTGTIAYHPVYNVYDNPPVTRYDNSVLVNQFGSANLTLANQTLVDGRRLSVVAIDGAFDRSSSSTTSVDTRAISASSRTVPVTAPDADSPVTLRFASRLPAEKWRTLLGDESHVQSVSGDAADAPGPFHGITVRLATGVTYRLQLSKVGVGTGATRESASYVTDVTGDGARLRQGESEDLVVEVRDEYNNPVTDVTVEAAVRGSDAGSVRPTTATTGDDGRATFTYETTGDTATGTHEVNVTILDQSALGPTFDPRTAENATLSVTVESPVGAGSAATDAGGGGRSTYSTGADNQTVTAENGRWRGIAFTDQFRYSDAATVVVQPAAQERFRSRMTIRNESAPRSNYSVAVALARSPDGSYPRRAVTLYDYDADSASTATLTPEAADALFADRYNATNVLNPRAYGGTGNLDATFESHLRAVAAMDGSETTILFSNTTGRSRLTLWDRTLVTAIEPDPATLFTDDAGEFVRLDFETPVNASGWRLVDDEGAVTDLPDETLSGTVYFAKDETAFESEHGFADGEVYPLTTPLEDDGDQVTLRDADGHLRDEVAYRNDTSATASTRHGWFVEDVGNGTVAVRETEGVDGDSLPRDDDARADWSTQSEGLFFGGGGSATVLALTEDLSVRNENAPRYVTSYEVQGAGGDLAKVGIRFRNNDDPSATAWNNSTQAATTRTYRSGYGAGNAYDVDVIAYDASGTVLASKSFADSAADARNATGNDELGGGSPGFTSYTIQDKSSNGNGARYDVDYTAESADFDRVRVFLVSQEPGAGGADETAFTATSDSGRLSTYGFDRADPNQFKVVLQAYDARNVVTDTVVWEDAADGNGRKAG